MAITEEKLSSKEVYILQLLADGETPRQLAPSVRLTELSVRQYVARIKEKLDVRTTQGAVAIAIRRGIID